MARFLQRVTLIERKKDGTENVSTLLRGKKGKKKKVTRWMRPTERVVNHYLKAEDRLAFREFLASGYELVQFQPDDAAVLSFPGAPPFHRPNRCPSRERSTAC